MIIIKLFFEQFSAHNGIWQYFIEPADRSRNPERTIQ